MANEIGSRAVVHFEKVGLRYGDAPDVLDDLSFVLRPGSFHFLTGPSGAGKTSLLRLMYLALRPSRGTVKLFGEDVAAVRRSRLAELRRRIGVVFQDFRLIADLSVFDNVALPLRVVGQTEVDVRRHVLELLSWVGLKSEADVLPSRLSGGQQQLVAVARAVIARPRLLIADEPTGSVDDQVARKLMYLFDELNRIGATVIVATHNEALVGMSKRPRLRLEKGRLSLEQAATATTARAATTSAAGGRASADGNAATTAKSATGKSATPKSATTAMAARSMAGAGD